MKTVLISLSLYVIVYWDIVLSVFHIGIQYHMQCSGSGIIYLDGNKVGETDQSSVFTSIAPRTARVVAVECRAFTADRVIMGSFAGPGPIIWKCTTIVRGTNWSNINYDDNNWPESVSYEKVERSGLFANVKKIWTENRRDSVVYCRGTIGRPIDNFDLSKMLKAIAY